MQAAGWGGVVGAAAAGVGAAGFVVGWPLVGGVGAADGAVGGGGAVAGAGGVVGAGCTRVGAAVGVCRVCFLPLSSPVPHATSRQQARIKNRTATLLDTLLTTSMDCRPARPMTQSSRRSVSGLPARSHGESSRPDSRFSLYCQPRPLGLACGVPTEHQKTIARAACVSVYNRAARASQRTHRAGWHGEPTVAPPAPSSRVCVQSRGVGR